MDTPTGVDSTSPNTKEAADAAPEPAPAPLPEKQEIVALKADEEYIPKWKAQEIIESRQKAKRERDDANARLAEFEAEKEAGKRHELELKGEYDRLIADLNTKTERIEAERAAEVRSTKFEKLMSGVMLSAGLDNSDEYVVRALLESIDKDYGDLDKDEPVGKKAVDAATRRMRERAPRLFTIRPAGGEKPADGISKTETEGADSTADARVQAVRNAARSLSQVAPK